MRSDPEVCAIDIPPRPPKPELDEDGLPEAQRHDERRLPHCYPTAAIEWMFPAALPPSDEFDYHDFDVGAGTRSPIAWTAESACKPLSLSPNNGPTGARCMGEIAHPHG